MIVKQWLVYQVDWRSSCCFCHCLNSLRDYGRAQLEVVPWKERLIVGFGERVDWFLLPPPSEISVAFAKCQG